MQTIKSIVVKNMRAITLVMVVIILLLSTVIQTFGIHQTNQENAMRIFSQVEQILEENARELEQVRAEYNAQCLRDARTLAYILEYNPAARDDIAELKRIADGMGVDEIHIFDKNGVIVAGTHPEYYGYSVHSGEQIGFFKPLLTDRSLELVQDITPNTAEGKLVQYSALWSQSGDFILQIGMAPANVLRATEKNELSYIFSLLRTGVGYNLYAVDPDTQTVEGATAVSGVGKGISEVGFQMEQLESSKAFRTAADGVWCYCFSRRIGGSYIVFAVPVRGLYKAVFGSEFLLLAGLLLIAVILVYAVTGTMERAVIDQIQRVNQKLREIKDGNLKTKVCIDSIHEFRELSEHINSMVDSLLQSTEKLEMSEQIRLQKEELERQHEALELAAERAQAANKAKSAFLFNMSHDIRTPMNAILGFTGLALESSDAETQRAYLENIDISSRQLCELIDNILELSQIENHKITIEEAIVDANENFRKLCMIFDSDLKEKNLSCEIHSDIRHPYLYLDTMHYSQVFRNLVSNAVKYTPEGGSLRISCCELPGETPETCITETVVEDNGIGMSEEFLAHACESFSRERTSTASGIQGTGLGLTIVKELVALMHGSIRIESRQGEGTKVTVRLPHRLGCTPAGETTDFARDRALFENKRILLAEDIDINAMIADKLLTSRGFLVERARDGVECVDMLQKATDGYYDLILMDIQMPNMDGYQAARSIRSCGERDKASTPIIALTANAFKEDRARAAECGMNGHIAKPLDAPLLFEMLADVLQESGRAG